jgi:hypothetical protein
MLSFDRIAPAPDCGAFGFNGWGFPLECGSDRPATSPWGIVVGGGSGAYDDGSSGSWLQRSILGRGATGSFANSLGIYDWEIRFTGAGKGWLAYSTGGMIDIPFEVWRTGIATPNDPSDDVRIVPAIFDADGNGAWNLGDEDYAFSGGANDPVTDWIYFFMPDDESPGDAGYQSFFFGPGDAHEVLARQSFGCWNCFTTGAGNNVTSEYYNGPVVGSVFRYSTKKPNNTGDVFSFSTATYDADGDGVPDALGASAKDYAANETDMQDLLDGIGVVPNPYRGASAYEKSQLIDEVRFTGLPESATIRIFTLNGTLIRTLEKSGSGRTLPWDLTTDNQLPIASGLYLIHVDVGNGREKVLKFAVVKKRVHLNVF